MRKTIFEIENRLNIEEEYTRLKKILLKSSTIYYDGRDYSLFGYLEHFAFANWKYRDTFVNLNEFLEHIGVFLFANGIEEISFLNFMELLLNLLNDAKKYYNYDNLYFRDSSIKNTLEHNIPIILEKMNYEIYEIEDMICIRKRDADVDSVLELVPEDISVLLLDYNDIRNNKIEVKKSILKSLDLFIEKDKKEYQSYDGKLYDSIQTIVNNMGINHPIKNEPFINFSLNELMEWYDKCFFMILHLIRCKKIIEIKKERLDLIKSDI